ncbi:hypothetical protein COLO4_29341 [Corchorus olitorius]|uniref:Uncharacterized protein n=1 Tax=Corchorus olitorius TaxID=93759 RepID=A0A1R3HF50_9ROSI|nr:hypothetical protein COLO4_29341 [Corchorus olitorius]
MNFDAKPVDNPTRTTVGAAEGRTLPITDPLGSQPLPLPTLSTRAMDFLLRNFGQAGDRQDVSRGPDRAWGQELVRVEQPHNLNSFADERDLLIAQPRAEKHRTDQHIAEIIAKERVVAEQAAKAANSGQSKRQPLHHNVWTKDPKDQPPAKRIRSKIVVLGDHDNGAESSVARVGDKGMEPKKPKSRKDEGVDRHDQAQSVEHSSHPDPKGRKEKERRTKEKQKREC